MHVFLTGAGGWIGRHTVDELLAHGHRVTALARTEAAAAALSAKGATALPGDLDDLEALRRGATSSDAVIHLANKHDWANPAESNRAERTAVQTIADSLTETDHPFLFASGLASLATGRASTENDLSLSHGPDSPRGGAENLAFEFVPRGVRVIAARFAPTVHGTGDHGFISYLVAAARRTGVSGYVGDGDTAWSAVHVHDAARLVRLALEGAPAGTRLHAVAETAVLSRDIAGAIGRSLNLPVKSIDPADAVEHFGFLGHLFGRDMTATSDITRTRFDWTPTGPTLLDDIAAGAYA
ncbi:NAD-dependent epimerase/dehydratase family protein [Actinoplanes couchii]|uniref:Oxidoreductase n=1 Tax=Actinoplanes couchii TaxID=403638 RepID=A0ABQ3XFZ9_9ACTN|nr:NAD-dependent epimerase/dehydratase family protein [Actinoplanes couchii]MDR6320881.1 nucleoside-diphosphate-sugar epimerase [Actinoplanes couchii]GID57393.1 oxidoreductase [Actinoplanes couchii]